MYLVDKQPQKLQGGTISKTLLFRIILNVSLSKQTDINFFEHYNNVWSINEFDRELKFEANSLFWQ